MVAPPRSFCSVISMRCSIKSGDQQVRGARSGANPGHHWQCECDASTIQSQCDSAGHRISKRTYNANAIQINRKSNAN